MKYNKPLIFISLVSTLLISLITSLEMRTSYAQADNLVVFSTNRDGNGEIYTMNPDGSNLQRLTSNTAEDKDPTWSPDRNQIAFVSNRDGTSSIYLMDSNGGNQRRLSPTDSNYYDSPTWSPDGQQLAFISDLNGGLDVFVMSLNGGQPRSLTTSSAGPENIDPSWSPDGRQIAFASNTEQYFQIYVTDTSGSNVWRITTQNNVDHYSPSWSPDGAEIAYAVNGNGYSEIYIANADGSNERLVTVSDGSFAGSLTWSPDGASLMFVVWSSSSSRTIRAINIDGSSVYQVTDSSVESDFPDWDSPDPISSIAQAGVMSIPASDFDTYPGGYRVEIYQYEIDTAADTIRMYFEATASQTDLRPPPGTYLATSSGNIAPTNLDWSSTGATYYTGWFEFEGRYFRSSSGVSLIYCGCGFYSIPITDLSGYFTGSGHSSWNLFWDSDQVPCGNTTITYYDFESEAQFSADKSTFQRTVVGGDSPTYTLSPQGTYVLEHTYYDLDATVTSEVITVLSDNVLAGERVDNFSGCTLTVTYFMRRIQ